MAKKTRTKLKHLFSQISLLLVVAISVGYIAMEGLGPRPPAARGGVLNLSGWDLESKGDIPLNGTWEFYPHQLLTPTDFDQLAPAADREYIRVPGVWNGHRTARGEKLSGDGYGTYRLVVTNLSTPGVMGLHLRKFASAYTLWINGRRVATNGIVGSRKAATIPQYRPLVVYFQPDGPSLDIVLQVANYHHSKGGFWQRALLGTAEQIRRLREWNIASAMFLVGALVLLAAYHFRLYLLNKKESSAHWFGFLCTLTAIRMSVVDEAYITSLLPNLSWNVLCSLEYLVLFLLPAVFTSYIRSLFPKETPRPLGVMTWTVSGLFALSVLVLPVHVYTRLAGVGDALAAAVLVYIIFGVVLRAVLRKRESATWVLAGTISVTITAVRDMLIYANYASGKHVLGLGVFLFALSQVFALSKKSSDASARIETLNAALADDRYREMFENTGTAMVMLRADQSVLLMNAECQSMLGYTFDELIGRRWTEFVVGEEESQPPGHPGINRRGMITPGVHEIMLRHKNGEARHVLATTSLIPGTRTAVASVVDITDRKRAEEEILYLSFHDKLTGLYNRAFLEAEAERLDREEELPISLIMGDVNGLKLVNDAFGHHQGDELLCRIAEVLSNSCRAGDVIARWGGDEFAIFLPGASAEAAAVVCDRITATCAGLRVGAIPLSISLGAATKVDMSQDTGMLWREAEDRMYRRKLLESRSAQSAIISSLSKALWERSHETEEHAERMGKMASRFGEALGFSPSQLDELALLATLHDIGKVGVPNLILEKPEPLGPEEWEIMKKHSEIGYRIAQGSPKLAATADAILAHHERWDGTGYPKALKGTEIPLISRALAIVDAFDVMTHARPYKEAMTTNQALAELSRCAGTQFDPEMVPVFVEMVATRRSGDSAEALLPGEPSVIIGKGWPEEELRRDDEPVPPGVSGAAS